MKRFVFNTRFMIGFPSEDSIGDVHTMYHALMAIEDNRSLVRWEVDTYDGNEDEIGYDVYPNGFSAIGECLRLIKKEKDNPSMLGIDFSSRCKIA